MTRQLILLGSGHAHVHVLASLAKRPLSNMQVTLVSPYPHLLDFGMVPGFVAGQYTLDDCSIPMGPLVKRANARWLMRHVVALDPQAHTVLLDNGTELHYDWLSIDAEPVQERERIQQTIPGAREHGLFLRPIEAFCTLWPRVPELASTRAVRVAVICDDSGGNDVGVELATAIRQRLPQAAVTLITGGAPLAAGNSPALKKRWVQAMRLRSITVLADVAIGIDRGQVLLGCGASLACDVPVIATGMQAPAWVARSGLALDEHGFVAVDAYQRSISHGHVFTAREDAAMTGRLATHLAAVAAGAEPRGRSGPLTGLKLLSYGDGYAIASWGQHAAQGRWVGWLKHRMDRARVAKFSNNLPGHTFP